MPCESLAYFLMPLFCLHWVYHKEKSHNVLFKILLPVTAYLLLHNVTWSVWFRFDLLSTECALQSVPVLAFDAVFLCFEDYGNVNIFAFMSLYLRFKPLGLIPFWFVLCWFSVLQFLLYFNYIFFKLLNYKFVFLTPKTIIRDQSYFCWLWFPFKSFIIWIWFLLLTFAHILYKWIKTSNHLLRHNLFTDYKLYRSKSWLPPSWYLCCLKTLLLQCEENKLI